MNLMIVICPYCLENCVLNRYNSYECSACDARVGCHKGTMIPLGIPVNRETREWRMKAHASFDQLWKLRFMTRKGAYNFLSQALKISFTETHIANFDISTCRQVVEISENKLKFYLWKNAKSQKNL